MTNQPPEGPRWDPITPWPPPDGHPFQVAGPTPPPKMSAGGKIVLGVLVAILALCGAGALAGLVSSEDASERVSVQTTTRETFLPPETTAAPTTTAAAPPETFSDPTPPPTTARPTTTLNPDIGIALDWFAWMSKYSELSGSISDDAKAGDLIAVLVGCNRGIELVNRTPANMRDPIAADLIWRFLEVQRRSFVACTQGDIKEFGVLQPQAVALLDELTARLEELKP